MIVTVPMEKRKYSYNKYKRINESIFDDEDDLFSLDDSDDDNQEITNMFEENYIKPKVEHILKLLSVENYEILCTGNGVLVNVHDHLFLPNRKLNKLNIKLFKFNIVDGDCVYTGNNLSDWSLFPAVVKGNCYANFNNIKTFEGAPIVDGRMIANKQNKKPTYPLTQANYDNVKGNRTITENSVIAIPVNRKGEIYSISENTNTCIIKFADNTKLRFKLNEVEYIGNLIDVFI